MNRLLAQLSPTPPEDWQTPLALCCVLLAGGVLLRRLAAWLIALRSSSEVSPPGGCGSGCGQCGSYRDRRQLVELELTPPRS